MERFELAVDAVTRAGAALRASRVESGDVHFKTGYKDLVTYWDRQTEQLLRKEILSAFPDDTIVGEEYPPSGSSGIAWYIDPIDGTTNFVNQHRNYSVSVGCWDGDRPLFGLVLDVEREAMYSAKPGGGAWRNGVRLRVSGRTDLREMLLTSPGVQYTFLERHEWHAQMTELARAVRGVRCLGSVALELCELAAGEADMFVTLRSSPWDHNAARIVLAEAGGAISTVNGSPLPVSEKSTVLAANSRESLNAALKLLGGSGPRADTP